MADAAGGDRPSADPPAVGRRAVLAAALVAAAGALAACVPPGGQGQSAPGNGAARLTARPGLPASATAELPAATTSGLPAPTTNGLPAPTTNGLPASTANGSPATNGLPAPGLHTLDLGPGPQVLLHVPPGTERPRLVVALHGAGEAPGDAVDRLRGLADAHGLLLLAPAAHDVTWDLLLLGWGADVRRLDQALAAVFAAHDVDPARLAISGFSDGATYALSLGIANADLFTHVIAFSPGALADGPRVGTPRVFVSHGRTDEVFPIDDSTRRIVAQLDRAHVPTEVRVFDGPHTVPPDVAEAAVRWFLGPP